MLTFILAIEPKVATASAAWSLKGIRMGVDWIPFRVKAARSREELCEHVSREAIQFRANGSSIPLVQRSLTATGSWTKRPEVVACRNEILAEPLLILPPPPHWPEGDGESDLSLVERAFTKVESSVREWNRAVPRGNVRLGLPNRPLEFDQCIAARLKNEWYSSFLEWVEPWRRGGNGLYRDCE